MLLRTTIDRVLPVKKNETRVSPEAQRLLYQGTYWMSKTIVKAYSLSATTSGILEPRWQSDIPAHKEFVERRKRLGGRHYALESR